MSEFRYRKLVRAIGPGFHPETRGYEYDLLPPAYSPGRVDQIIEEAYRDKVDVFLIAEEILGYQHILITLSVSLRKDDDKELIEEIIAERLIATGLNIEYLGAERIP